MTEADSRVGTNESRAQDSRDEILKAATQRFAERGFHETSMSEVAREAGVSKALIFWHFRTKEELFLAVLNKLLQPYYIDFAEEAEKLDEREQIRKLIGGYINFVRVRGPALDRRRDPGLAQSAGRCDCQCPHPAAGELPAGVPA